MQTHAQLPLTERVRRGAGRLSRRTVASTKVSVEERSLLEAAARGEGKVLSEWARDVLISAARGERCDNVLLTELTALRLLMSTVLRSVALGEKMTPEAFQQVLAEVKSRKHDTARDVLAQYQPATQREA